MIGVICMLESEAKRLKGAMHNQRTDIISGFEFFYGTLCGHEVVASLTNSGKVFAAMCAQTMVLKYSPSFIINTGIAEPLEKSISTGSAFVADKVLQFDFDTSALGHPLGSIPGIGRIYINCSGRLTETMRESIAGIQGLNCSTGILASGDEFVVESERRESIADNFGASVCDMGGAAIGQVCYCNDIGFSLVRIVIDSTGGNVGAAYTRLESMAADLLCLIIERFFNEWPEE